VIDKLAQQGKPDAFRFPRPVIAGLDYSFSGLKTSILYFLRDQLKKHPGFIESNKADLAAAVQYTIIEILTEKLIKASETTGIREIAIAGGVSANSGLRNKMLALSESQGWNVFLPEFQYSTDNAAMIAIAGYYKYLNNDFCELSVTPYSRSRQSS
jgi:N6-L-threonylcarbamoyladenine synthase